MKMDIFFVNDVVGSVLCNLNVNQAGGGAQYLKRLDLLKWPILLAILDSHGNRTILFYFLLDG